MQSIKFSLPIAPTSQARPRVAVRGKFAQAYKTKDQQANERTLEALLMKYAPEKPFDGPLVLEFVAYMPIPRSASKKRVESILGGFEVPTKKPDIDNLAKQLLDCMTRLQFWHDDVQIVCLRCEKCYRSVGSWDVAVYDAVRRGREEVE